MSYIPHRLTETVYNPRTGEALEVPIVESPNLGALRKVGNHVQVEVTMPVIKTRHNGKSRMVGEFEALNTYTISDSYPIPRIHERLTQLSQAYLITAMYSLTDYNHNFSTENLSQPWQFIPLDFNMAYPCHVQYMAIWPYS
ncbi:hypothetical protein O181_091848 [Austropuccinia psidii MF-1]|uniref:Uncharacterized protein n=1 Tax=Austropuccinia psidii MF-1 TaxID=1389203 RepID=A0A9Q3IY59_9BASI|nr:hypothetical protein [Austropuccinia psidii MF-1]